MELTRLIVSSRAYLNCFDYDHYPDCLETFEKAAAPLLSVSVSDPELLIDELERIYADLPRRERKEAAIKDKQVLALYLSPAALRIGNGAEAYARLLCEKWNQHYPRNRYIVGDYDTIMKGFDANLLGLPLRKSSRR